ncbi:hypothetical protein OCU04_011082 [Sclerotinia nivalis]|uniref:Uncharacterized protein n=1 Tax=Sclerotinia nivalis TaxID=352851 RepID=A0A9X0ADF6_9HELO|nr:hypothetical protein OCU04_011082 [Sclerotinia nivalis]
MTSNNISDDLLEAHAVRVTKDKIVTMAHFRLRGQFTGIIIIETNYIGGYFGRFRQGRLSYGCNGLAILFF